MDCSVYIWYEGNRPFYVGMGNSRRLKNRQRNPHATIRRKKAEQAGIFRQEVVLSGSRKSCEETEKFLISFYGSVTEGGLLFNFSAGGEGGDTFTFQSEERKREITKKRKQKLKDGQFKTMGKAGGTRTKELHPDLAPEWAKQMVNERKGIHDPSKKDRVEEGVRRGRKKAKKVLSKPVLCVTTGTLYPSLREAGRNTGVCHASISACCRGKQKTAGGLIWQFT